MLKTVGKAITLLGQDPGFIKPSCGKAKTWNYLSVAVGFQDWGWRRVVVPNLLFLILHGGILIGYFESPLHLFSADGVIFQVILTTDTEVTHWAWKLVQIWEIPWPKNQWGSSLYEVLLELTSVSLLSFHSNLLCDPWAIELRVKAEKVRQLLLCHCKWDRRYTQGCVWAALKKQQFEFGD